MWNEGLIYKIKSMGVKDDLLTLIETFFFMERQQRIVLNGQESERMIVKTGMPWGSILGPLLFIYILIIYQII